MYNIAVKVLYCDAKSGHFEDAAGDIAPFVVTLVEFILGEHEILKLVGCINGSGVFPGVRVGFEAGPFILEHFHGFDVELVSFDGGAGEIFAVGIVGGFRFVDSFFDFLWRDRVDEGDHFFGVEFVFAELVLFSVFEQLQELELIWVFKGQNITFKTTNYSESNQNN